MTIKAYQEEIGERGVIFQYNDENLVYLIKGDDKLFLCDTHEGPLSMDYVVDYIEKNNLTEKELFIFNSHSDFDHVWGNCAFDNIIIAHSFARKRLKETWDYYYEVKSKYHNGEVRLKLPDLIFNDTLKFCEEEIEFTHTPGHTIDSALCIDHRDKVAYVGDLVEFPIIVIGYYHLEQYIQSLKYIKRLADESYTIVTSHSGIADKSLIDDNMRYILNLIRDKEVDLDEERFQNRHNFNKKNLMILRYEKTIKDKLGTDFDYKKYKKDYWSKFGIEYEQLDQEYFHIINTSKEKLEKALQEFISEI